MASSSAMPPPMLSAGQAKALHAAHGDVKRPGNLVALACVLTGLATLTFGGRMYSRLLITRNPGIDDGFLTFAWLFLIGILVTYVIEDNWGSGYHAYVLTPNEIIHFFHAFWATLWCYCGCLACVKMALLFQYKKLFPTPGFQRAVKVMLVVVGLSGVWSICSGIFICWPIPYFWTRMGNGKCLETWPLFIGNGVLNIVTDLFVLASPLPVLHRLHLPKRQKLALMAVFLVGAFVIVVSAIRLAVFIQSDGATDFSWEQIVLGGWSFAECAVAVICASVPALKPMLLRAFPRFGTSSTNRSRTIGYTAASKAKSEFDAEAGPITLISHGGQDPIAHGSIGHASMFNDKGDGIQVVTAVSAHVDNRER